MRNRIIIWCLGIIWLLGMSSGYFESRYRCTISAGNITVSLQSGNQKCFSYLSTTQISLTELNNDLRQARDFITWGSDVDYWTTVVASLETQKSSLETSRDQTIAAIVDFERALFIQIQSLLEFHLTDDRTSALTGVRTTKEQLIQARLRWDTILFNNLQSTMEWFQHTLFLLDRILFAHDFEEMMPFLKEYLSSNSI